MPIANNLLQFFAPCLTIKYFWWALASASFILAHAECGQLLFKLPLGKNPIRIHVSRAVQLY